MIGSHGDTCSASSGREIHAADHHGYQQDGQKRTEPCGWTGCRQGFSSARRDGAGLPAENGELNVHECLQRPRPWPHTGRPGQGNADIFASAILFSVSPHLLWVHHVFGEVDVALGLARVIVAPAPA